ncbi:MAG: VOC family protein [Terrimesophilobacter sp.]
MHTLPVASGNQIPVEPLFSDLLQDSQDDSQTRSTMPETSPIGEPTFPLDHIAIGTDRYDDTLQLLVMDLGMVEGRHGTHFSTGNRIVMLRSPDGSMIELVESATPAALMHLAYRVEDVEQSVAALQSAGLQEVRPPHALDAAKAETALLVHVSGLQIQVIKYESDSPDLAHPELQQAQPNPLPR